MTEYSAKWIIEAYTEFRLTIEQISDITNRDFNFISSLLESNNIIGGKSKKLKKVSKRKKNKKAAIIYLGGCCKICGYDSCEEAFEFHHTNRLEKDFTISYGCNLNWPDLKKELDKCILVCCRCHREVHSSD